MTSIKMTGLTVLLPLSAIALVLSCSVTIDSGETHGIHHEPQEEPATSTPTPTPAATLHRG